MAISKSRVYEALAAGSVTASGATAAVGIVENFDEILACLITTASTKAATLDAEYQVSPDDGTTWFTHTAMATQLLAAAGVLTLAGNAVAAETVTIGSTVYTWVSALTEAKAAGVLTLTGVGVEGETVTIGTTVYTWRAAPTVAYDVDIGVDAATCVTNLVAAVTYDGGAGTNEGTLYGTGTVAHADVTAADGTGDTVDVTALVIGTAGNAIATTETMTNGSFGAATLENGANAVAYEVLVGGSASASIDNLIAAINGAAGEGTTYATDTVAHATVQAAAGAGDTMDAWARAMGADGNSIASTETMTQGSWGAATLASGTGTGLVPLTNVGTLGRIDYTLGGTTPDITLAVKLVGKRRG